MKAKMKKPDGFRRSPCAIASTLDLVGDKWSLLVIRDMLHGKRTFGELLESPEKIPTNILADRLKRLGLQVPPASPLDPSFYLRRPGGKIVHLFRALATRVEAVTVLAARASADPEAVNWAEKLPAEDFVDLVQRLAAHP